MSKKVVKCASAPLSLPEDLAVEIDEIYTNLPNECKNYITKSYEAEYDFIPGERSEVSKITTDTVDASNEVVLPKGVVLDNFRKYGSILYNHDNGMPVGHCEWIKEVNNSIRAKSNYPQHPKKEKWQIDYIWELIQTSVLKGKSIGFLPLEPRSEPTNEELELRPEWKDAGIWRKVLLLEYSVVSQPCNSDALCLAINTKSLDRSKFAELGISVPPEEVQETIEEILEEVKVEEVIETKADDCVSNKIKEMYDAGEDSKFSREQIAAIAFAHCNSKCLTPKVRKKLPNPNIILASIIDKIQLDHDTILEAAKALYRDRGRV